MKFARLAVFALLFTALLPAQVINISPVDPQGPCSVGFWVNQNGGALWVCNNTVWNKAGTPINSSLLTPLNTAATGTGAVVLGTSPTITSATLTSPTASGATLSGTTALATATFSAAPTASTAAGVGLGTAALPWSNLILGTAATNVATITPATMAAARAITLPDPGGAATMAFTNPTTQQALSNTTIAQATTTVPYTQYTTPQPMNGTSGLTSTTDANGTEFWTQIYVPTTITATGACAMVGAGTPTDKWIGVVWNQSGTVVANSATAGTTFSGSAANWQCQAFSPGTVTLNGPQLYFIGLQGNGATAGQFYTYATGFGQTGFITNSVAGSFGTVANITPGTTFNGGKGPVMSLY